MAVSLRLPDDISARLNELAQLTGRSRASTLEEVEKRLGLAD